MASTFVDARFAGGPIVVSGSEFAGQSVVRVQVPGQNPVPLFAQEARALARELVAYAAGAERAREKNAPAGQDEGSDQFNNYQEGIRS